jgi:hypothetical protein
MRSDAVDLFKKHGAAIFQFVDRDPNNFISVDKRRNQPELLTLRTGNAFLYGDPNVKARDKTYFRGPCIARVCTYIKYGTSNFV